MNSSMLGGGHRGRALVVITDGLGFDPWRVRDLSRRVIDALGPIVRRSLLESASEVSPGSYIPLELARLSVMPIAAEGVSPGITWRGAMDVLDKVGAIRERLRDDRMLSDIVSLRRRIALENSYVPWFAEDLSWSEIVNRSLTVPTDASGVWVGYEDVYPPVQGNSETGHQQIGNLALAPQIPLQISDSIRDGSFFENENLLTTIRCALSSGNNVNFCFLLSGLGGSDGRVHSDWNHLEAFCELLFGRLRIPSERVRMQAILDGRDAPSRGSLELDGVEGGYLGELARLLSRYDALDSLAWVIGRSYAMDRDYRVGNAACDYALLTEGAGEQVWGIDEVRKMVYAYHEYGRMDSDVEGIAVMREQEPRLISTIKSGDAFINLNFRSDRQRSKTAMLCGAKGYLYRESRARGRSWDFSGLRDNLKLHMCTITEYDAEFEDVYGVNVAYPIMPHSLNFLSHWDRLMPSGERYMLAGESVKASHMGYFVRGRREAELASNCEDRWIVPSDGSSENVNSDSDFHLHPEMKTREISQLVSEAMVAGEHHLIMCNLASPDMIGHLLPLYFDSAVEAYRVTVSTLVELSEVARANGYSMLVTSDHGNIENSSPTHTSNPVLTTVLPIRGRLEPCDLDGEYSAKLYDISHTAARLIGVDKCEIDEIVGEFRGRLDEKFVGKSIVG